MEKNKYGCSLKVALYPYNNTTNDYISSMQRIIESEYEVVNYCDYKRGAIKLSSIDYLYLNWIENIMDEDDEYAIKKAKECGIKIIWVFHNRIPHDSENPSEAERRMRFMIDNADSIIIHSKASIDVLTSFGEVFDVNKALFVPHINYCEKYYDYVGDVRKGVGFSEDDFVVGFLGAIRPYKNIELLIECFSDIRTNNTNVKLLIAGKSKSKEYGDKIDRMINNNPNIVFINDFINDLAMGSFLKAVDILALPYDVRSSLNSGSMIMAFSYSKSVIIPKIAMSEEYSDKLIYKYTYSNEEDHIRSLGDSIQKAYTDGRSSVLLKGEQLYGIVKKHNAEENIKKILLDIFRKSKPEKADPVKVPTGNRFKYLYDVSFAWLELEKTGKHIADFFYNNGLKRIAIYGMGKVGRMLLDEFHNTDIQVLYAVDRKAEFMNEKIDIYSPEDILPKADAIVITVADYNEVVKQLKTEECIMLNLYDVIQCAKFINNRFLPESNW